MRTLIKAFIFIADIAIAMCVISLAIYCEYKLIFTSLYPLVGEEFSEWLTIFLLVVAGITLYVLAILNAKIFEFLFPEYRKKKIINNIAHADYTISTIRNKTDNEFLIISKPLGGYKREQLNNIYLLGILIHQIYYSAAVIPLSDKQQRITLCIQMRFFITVFPQRNVKEYFDFTEAFMDKNKGLFNYSVLEALEQSMRIFSSCSSKQIRKLQTLYNTLYTFYIEIGSGNKAALTTYVEMLDTELSNLIVEDDWRNHYAKKKTQ